MTQHLPYQSLEQFREKQKPDYCEIFVSDIIVQEKIHGSNICIVGNLKDGKLTWNMGSRKRWIKADENFNNFQILFKKHIEQFINIFTELSIGKKECTIRIYGEIFGGQYGSNKEHKSFMTQKEPNYCANNDFAFFDIYVDENKLPILKTIEVIQKNCLKVPPVIYKGPIKIFFEKFNVNEFESVVSNEFYKNPYIKSIKGTEGVTIRTTNPLAIDEETTIIKWKQDWALENGRVTLNSPPKVDSNIEIEKICLDMVNENRITSFASKITREELINPKLISNNVKEIVEDTMKDVEIEFPPHLNPTIKFKNIKKKIIGKVYPMFKSYIN